MISLYLFGRPPGGFHPAGDLRPRPEQPRGNCRLLGAEELGGLPVAEAGHVDRDEDVPEYLREPGDHLEHLARLGSFLGPAGQARIDRLEAVIQRLGSGRRAGRAARADEGVSQDLQQVAEIVVAANPARLGEHAGERLLDEILGVGTRTGQRPGGAEKPVDVVAQGVGIEEPVGGRHRVRA